MRGVLARFVPAITQDLDRKDGPERRCALASGKSRSVTALVS